MIEDWLARKNPEILSSGEGRLGYIKILELYCLHILPRLEEWDFAQDFLQYERELDAEMRQVGPPLLYPFTTVLGHTHDASYIRP